MGLARRVRRHHVVLTSAGANILDKDNPQCGWSNGTDSVYKDALSGYLTIDVVNYCTNYFPDQAHSTTRTRSRPWLGHDLHPERPDRRRVLRGHGDQRRQHLRRPGRCHRVRLAPALHGDRRRPSSASSSPRRRPRVRERDDGRLSPAGFPPSLRRSSSLATAASRSATTTRSATSPTRPAASCPGSWSGAATVYGGTQVQPLRVGEPRYRRTRAPRATASTTRSTRSVLAYDTDENLFGGVGIRPARPGQPARHGRRTRTSSSSRSASTSRRDARLGPGRLQVRLGRPHAPRRDAHGRPATTGLYNMGWVGVQHTAPGAFISVGHAAEPQQPVPVRADHRSGRRHTRTDFLTSQESGRLRPPAFSFVKDRFPARHFKPIVSLKPAALDKPGHGRYDPYVVPCPFLGWVSSANHEAESNTCYEAFATVEHLVRGARRAGLLALLCLARLPARLGPSARCQAPGPVRADPPGAARPRRALAAAQQQASRSTERGRRAVRLLMKESFGYSVLDLSNPASPTALATTTCGTTRRTEQRPAARRRAELHPDRRRVGRRAARRFSVRRPGGAVPHGRRRPDVGQRLRHRGATSATRAPRARSSSRRRALHRVRVPALRPGRRRRHDAAGALGADLELRVARRRPPGGERSTIAGNYVLYIAGGTGPGHRRVEPRARRQHRGGFQTTTSRARLRRPRRSRTCSRGRGSRATRRSSGSSSELGAAGENSPSYRLVSCTGGDAKACGGPSGRVPSARARPG